jgi:hypothetical protein
MEVSIEEKAKAVFEWAGLSMCYWRDKLMCEAPDKTVFRLPMPDDIEFLGYIDKYVESKLIKEGWYVTTNNINWFMGEHIEKWDCEVWNGGELSDTNITSIKRESTKGLALLNSIYEVIK